MAPAPDSGIDNVGFDAFELIVNFPLVDPLVCGLKLILKLTLCPALRVAGGAMPLKLYPAPVVVICEIVTAVLPEFVTVSATVFVLET
jgi:hypothetical protein